MGSADTKGRITTFYSYKGGTGRTMALANVAWVLAAAGRRVLTVDWDLEAPGLNRYFAPFLDDPECKRSEGLLDWIYEYLVALTQPHACPEDPDWAEPYAALDGYANSLKWQFPGEGCLHFIAAGQQSSGYAERVNKLDWFRLYTEHGGKAFVETAFRQARERYDDILIDSRTGVADTSGICTIQLPDQLVAAYTLNNQSIEGCSEVARNAALSRDAERRPLTVLPVATRVEFAEDDRLKRRQVLARSRFEQFVPERDRGSYFGRQQLPYVPFYAYEEVLATIRERPDSGHPLLLGFVALAREVAGRDIESLPDISPAKRDAALLRYAATSGAESATVGVQPNSEGVTPPTGTAPKEASKAWDVFVSYPMDRTDAAEALHRQLSARATAFIASRSIPVGANRDETVKRACESAAVHVFVIGPQSPIPNGWYASELEQALDRARRTGSPKIVPVIVDGAPFDRARYPQLQEFQALKMNSGGERAAAEAILDALGVVPARSHELERERAVSAEVRLEQLSVSSRRASQIWLAAAILSSVGVVAAGLWQHGQSVADRQKLIDSANALQRQKDDSVRVIKSTKEQGLTDVFKAQLADLEASILSLSSYVETLSGQLDPPKEVATDASKDKTPPSVANALVMNPLLDDARARVSGPDGLASKRASIAQKVKDANLESDSQLSDTLQTQQTQLTNLLVKIAAIAARVQALPVKPDDRLAEPRRLWQEGYDLANSGDVNGATEKYNASLQKNPGYAPAINSLGVIQYNARNFDAAKVLFDRAVKEDPSYAPAYTNLALVLKAQNKPAEATSSAKKALQIRPGYVPALNALSAIETTRGLK